MIIFYFPSLVLNRIHPYWTFLKKKTQFRGLKQMEVLFRSHLFMMSSEIWAFVTHSKRWSAVGILGLVGIVGYPDLLVSLRIVFFPVVPLVFFFLFFFFSEDTELKITTSLLGPRKDELKTTRREPGSSWTPGSKIRGLASRSNTHGSGQGGFPPHKENGPPTADFQTPGFPW